MADEDDDKPKQRLTVDIDKGLPAGMLDPNTPIVTWDNRRRMAWLSLYSMLGLAIGTALLIWMTDAPGDKKSEHFVDLFFYAATTFSAVILGYFGATTLPWIGAMKK